MVVVSNGRPKLEESPLMIDEALVDEALALSDAADGVEQFSRPGENKTLIGPR